MPHVAYGAGKNIYNKCMFKDEVIPTYAQGAYQLEIKKKSKAFHSFKMDEGNVIRAVGGKCHKKCQKYCGLAFKLINEDNADSDVQTRELHERLDNMYGGKKKKGDAKESENETLAKDMNLYLNFDQISKCLQYCAAGETYRGHRVEYKADDGKSVQGFGEKIEVSNDIVCSEDGESSASYPYYIGRSKGDFHLKVVNSGENYKNILGSEPANKIYTCGYETLFVDSCNEGKCQNLSGRYRWQNGQFKMPLNLRRNDDIELRYYGRYHSDKKYNTSDYNLYFHLDVIPGGKLASQFDFPPPDQDDYDDDKKKSDQKDDDSFIELGRGCFRGGILSVNGASNPKIFLKDKNNVMSKYGKSKKAYCNSKYKVDNKAGIGCLKPKSGAGYNKMIFPDFAVSSTFQCDVNEPLLWLNDFDQSKSSGGYNLDITWRGCRVDNASAVLKYMVVKVDGDGDDQFTENSIKFRDAVNKAIKSGKWKSIGSDEEIVIKEKGRVYVKIDYHPQYRNEIESNVKRLFSHIANMKDINDNHRSALGFGGFEVIAGEGLQDGGDIFCQTIREFKDQIFGRDRKSGLVKRIYTGIIEDSAFVHMVRIAMIIFISYTAIAFMLGISQINQKEAIIKIIKLSIVAAIVSETSWQLFYEQFLIIFVEGLDVLVDNFSYSEGSVTCSAGGPKILFRLNQYISEIWGSDVVWPKFWALFFSSVAGFITAIVMFIAIIVYTVCLMRAFILYLMSLISIGIMIILAPVMIPLILFGFTKRIFDGWIKQFFVLVLQTVAVFAGISIFLGVMELLFQATLYFTICKSCLLSFFHLFCLIQYWVPVSNSHYPAGAMTPVYQLIPAICMLFVAQIMFTTISNIPSVLGRIVSFGAMSLDAKLGSFTGPAMSAAGKLPSMGLSKASSQKNATELKGREKLDKKKMR